MPIWTSGTLVIPLGNFGKWIVCCLWKL